MFVLFTFNELQAVRKHKLYNVFIYLLLFNMCVHGDAIIH